MSALSDMYNIWWYPRPVGLKSEASCCGCEVSCDVDTDAIADAVVDAISDMEFGCSCETIGVMLDEKIQAAKDEIIRECKCEGCCPTPPPPCPCACPCDGCDMGNAIEQAANNICNHIDERFNTADIEGNFLNLNELVSEFIRTHQ